MEFNKWKLVRLEDILDLNPRLTIKKGEVAKKVAMEHISEFTRKIQGYETTEFKGGSKFQNGDTLMARITPCLENGKTAFVDILDENEVGFGSTEFFVLRAKEGISDPKYIYYLAISEEVRKVVIQSMTGTSGRQRAQKESLLKYEKSVPSFHLQKKIGEFLSALDEKIEINYQMISTIEKITQTIFHRWFVDLEFPNEKGEPYNSSLGKMKKTELGNIPEKWGVKDLGDISEWQNGYAFYKNGYSHSGYQVVDLANVNVYGQFVETGKDKYVSYETIKSNEKMEKYLLKKNDLVMIMTDRTQEMNILGKVGRINKTNKYVLNQRIFRIRVNDEVFLNYLYSILNSEWTLSKIKSLALGSAQKYINTNHITSLKIIIPQYEVLEEFYRQTDSLFKEMEILQEQTKNLKKLRNTLLPQLLSGELEVFEEKVDEHVSVY